MTTTTNRQAVARINLSALAHNFNHVKSLVPRSRVMAVIKANAYGHGATEIAAGLPAADGFGVARLREAISLREAGITQSICLLEGIVDCDELKVAEALNLDLVVHGDHQLPLLQSKAKSSGMPKDTRHRIWIKIDTGMGRLGFSPDKLAALLEKLSGHEILGVMTHLARADEEDAGPTISQLERFHSVSGSAVGSIANSAGILAHPDSHAEWVRPGVMLYGASPFVDLQPLSSLKPVMTFTAPIVAVRHVSRGQAVGYGGLWVADADCRLAVVAAGYGDGYPRELDNRACVLLNGKRRLIAGRVSMDMMSVRLAPDDTVQCGDEVVLWGEGLPVEEIAQYANTVVYTLLSGVTQRVPRVYLERHVEPHVEKSIVTQ